jgi:hypothetical protein
MYDLSPDLIIHVQLQDKLTGFFHLDFYGMIASLECLCMDDKITIIEGPPPVFEKIGEAWALGLNETPNLSGIALTRLRTFNGQALIERCQRAWSEQGTMHLEFRGMDGLESQTPILAARAVEIDEGQLLVLWVRVDQDQIVPGAEDQAGGGLDDQE